MHEQSHTIIQLTIHLPDQQRVYFRPRGEVETAGRAAKCDTHLTTWLKQNAHEITVPLHRDSEALCICGL